MACWMFDNFGEERSVLSSSSEKNLLVHGKSWWSFCSPGCITTRIPCREPIKFTNRTVDWAGPPQADELIQIPVFWECINRIKSSRFTTIWETLIEIDSPNLKKPSKTETLDGKRESTVGSTYAVFEPKTLILGTPKPRRCVAWWKRMGPCFSK